MKKLLNVFFIGMCIVFVLEVSCTRKQDADVSDNAAIENEAESKTEPANWHDRLQELGFWDRIAEIKSVSDSSLAVRKNRIPTLIVLLKDEDQSIRTTAATELGEIQDIAVEAIPYLIENFKYENGEEGWTYVEALASFGAQTIPLLEKELASESFLMKSRACDAIRQIDPLRYKDGECKERAN